MTTATTYTDLINLYALRLNALRDELVNVAQFPLTAARNSLITINNAVELACHDAGKNWGWLDAEEVVNAGGLADYLEESLGMEQADVQELMVQDWDCQDAEGLASRCICNHGGFDWLKLEELLEVDVEPDAVRSYIDWKLVARDMLLGSDVVEANGHYFRAT